MHNSSYIVLLTHVQWYVAMAALLKFIKSWNGCICLGENSYYHSVPIQTMQLSVNFCISGYSSVIIFYGVTIEHMYS